MLLPESDKVLFRTYLSRNSHLLKERVLMKYLPVLGVMVSRLSEKFLRTSVVYDRLMCSLPYDSYYECQFLNGWHLRSLANQEKFVTYSVFMKDNTNP